MIQYDHYNPHHLKVNTLSKQCYLECRILYELTLIYSSFAKNFCSYPCNSNRFSSRIAHDCFFNTYKNGRFRMACEMNRKQKHIQQIDRRKVLSYNSYQ